LGKTYNVLSTKQKVKSEKGKVEREKGKGEKEKVEREKGKGNYDSYQPRTSFPGNRVIDIRITNYVIRNTFYELTLVPLNERLVTKNHCLRYI